ncbi:MAG: APC family permease [Gammaproteobacteria bacterium]
MQNLKNRMLRTKPVSQQISELKRTLGAFDLTLLGIGAIIGAGIFVLTGIAAATSAGPAIVFSYLLAGLACTFTALSYAELSTSIGGCGSAYGYAYAGFGEFIAWIIGWDLILEYGVAVSAVAIGWSSYFNNALTAIGYELHVSLSNNIFEGGFVNLSAMLIVLITTALLAVGIKASKYFNSMMVFIKFLTILIFITIAAFHVEPQNWSPFVPFGWMGVVEGAALIFFSYIGFDAISTAAEETIDPQKNMPIGILSSLIICTVLYMLVAALLTGIAPYYTLNVSSPVSAALLEIGYDFAAAIVAAGAIAGLTTVILVMFYGLTRIFLAMSRDGLLPNLFSKVNTNTRTPVRIIISGGIVISLIAGFAPMSTITELVNIGTLMAFVVVCGGVIAMRYTQPDLKRPFKVAFHPLIPLLGIAICLFLALSLPVETWIRFGIWMAIGCALYFVYGMFNSGLEKGTNKTVDIEDLDNSNY